MLTTCIYTAKVYSQDDELTSIGDIGSIWEMKHSYGRNGSIYTCLLAACVLSILCCVVMISAFALTLIGFSSLIRMIISIVSLVLYLGTMIAEAVFLSNYKYTNYPYPSAYNYCKKSSFKEHYDKYLNINWKEGQKRIKNPCDLTGQELYQSYPGNRYFYYKNNNGVGCRFQSLDFTVPQHLNNKSIHYKNENKKVIKDDIANKNENKKVIKDDIANKNKLLGDLKTGLEQIKIEFTIPFDCNYNVQVYDYEEQKYKPIKYDVNGYFTGSIPTCFISNDKFDELKEDSDVSRFYSDYQKKVKSALDKYYQDGDGGIFTHEFEPFQSKDRYKDVKPMKCDALNKYFECIGGVTPSNYFERYTQSVKGRLKYQQEEYEKQQNSFNHPFKYYRWYNEGDDGNEILQSDYDYSITRSYQIISYLLAFQTVAAVLLIVSIVFGQIGGGDESAGEQASA